MERCPRIERVAVQVPLVKGALSARRNELGEEETPVLGVIMRVEGWRYRGRRFHKPSPTPTDEL